jgi:hypothetical protein
MKQARIDHPEDGENYHGSKRPAGGKPGVHDMTPTRAGRRGDGKFRLAI